MAIHIWLPGRGFGKTKDAGPAHAPAGSSKGGQFVSGSGGGGAKPTPKHMPMKQAEPEVAFRREMIAKNPRGTTFFYNNETKTTEAYHKGKLVGSLKDHS